MDVTVMLASVSEGLAPGCGAAGMKLRSLRETERFGQGGWLRCRCCAGDLEPGQHSCPARLAATAILWSVDVGCRRQKMAH